MIHIEKFDWLKIQTEYVSTDITLKDLAIKHKIPYDTMRGKSSKGKWQKHKAHTQHTLNTKMCERIADKKAKEVVKEIETVDSLAKDLLKKIAKALEETETHEFAEVTRKKQTGFNAKGVPVEVTKEEKEFKARQGKTNVGDLKRIADALEKIANIQDRYIQGAGEDVQIIIGQRNED